MSTLILRPNCKQGYNQEISSLRAKEPPLWHLLLCNAYCTNLLVDAEGENLSEQETIEKVLSHNPEKVIILSSGNHPSAYIQQKDISLKLDLLLTKKGLNVETYNRLPIDPCKCGYPKWELVDLNKYRAHNWHCFGYENRSPYGVIFTSVSCPFRCNFCAISTYYGTVFQQRLIEDVIKDFDDLAKLKVEHIKIMDELFIFNPHRVELICDDIIENEYKFNIWAYARIDIMNDKLLKKMKRAGINWLAFGIESGSEKIRKDVIKGNFSNKKIKEIIKMTKDNGIYCLGNFMFGFWEDNLNTMQKTLDLALELQCEFVNMYCTVAYPGSKLYDELKKKGIFIPSDSSSYAQMSNKFIPLRTKYLVSQDVLRFRDYAFNTYFTNMNYLSFIKKIFGWKVVKEIEEMASIKLKRDLYD